MLVATLFVVRIQWIIFELAPKLHHFCRAHPVFTMFDLSTDSIVKNQTMKTGATLHGRLNTSTIARTLGHAHTDFTCANPSKVVAFIDHTLIVHTQIGIRTTCSFESVPRVTCCGELNGTGPIHKLRGQVIRFHETSSA
jgi:hypothetical protein